MTQEEYSRVGTGSVHCAGTECSKAGECLHSLHNAQQEHEPVDIINGIIIYTAH